MKKYLLVGLCLLGSAGQADASTQTCEFSVYGHTPFASKSLPRIANIRVKAGARFYWYHHLDHSQATRTIVEPGEYNWIVDFQDGKRWQFRITLESSGEITVPADWSIEKVVADTVPELAAPAIKRKRSSSPSKLPQRKWVRIDDGRL